MALTFEYEKSIELKEQCQIVHEADSSLYRYYIDDRREKDDYSEHVFGIYTDTKFSDEKSSITTRPVDMIKIKGFPGVGAIGYYMDAYEDAGNMLVPIHSRHRINDTPSIQLTKLGDSRIQFDITANEQYECFRIVMRMEYFSYEYITYNTYDIINEPETKGTYDVYCIGYTKDGEISMDSSVVQYFVETGKEGFGPS